MKKELIYTQSLNPQQLAAVEAGQGPYLVIAGAGSGKTRILVYRVAYLIEHGVLPQEILLLTFTRKASQEMLNRAAALFDQRCSQVSGGTFHSFSHMVLRRYAAAANLSPYFTIMDQSDAESAVQSARSQLGLAKADERQFPKKRALLQMISKSLNTGMPVSQVVYEEFPHFFAYSEEIDAVRRGYIQFKQEKGLLDFDDLLIRARDVLREHPELRQTLSRRYRYIMVDEYQDTNRLQAEILYELLSEHHNIMAVGDDCQSIYAFRGANFKNIIEFPKVFPETTVITLEQNYRSVQSILSLTNRVISCAAEKFEKNLFSEREAGVLPLYVETYDEYSQARYVCRRIERLMREGIPAGDIAVLFRSGFHSNSLEIELAKNGRDFVKYGGMKFVDTAHVKDLLCYVRVVHNPKDSLCWSRVLTLLPGIGARTAAQLIGQIRSEADPAPLTSAQWQKQDGLRHLARLVFSADMSQRTPAEVVRLFRKYYQPLFERAYDDYHKRESDLDALERIAERYESLTDFLSDMSLEPPEAAASVQERENTDKSKLVLSTIHSAKGLEWHTVFIIFLCEGSIPSYRSLDKPDALEEERRLLYVAMTRAKEQLFLLQPRVDYSNRQAANRPGSGFSEPSRFLNEVQKLHRYVNTEQDEEVSESRRYY